MDKVMDLLSRKVERISQIALPNQKGMGFFRKGDFGYRRFRRVPKKRRKMPILSTKGGGVGLSRWLSQLPYDLENGRLYKPQLWETIKAIYVRQKTGLVNDSSLAMFPWQLIYLNQILLSHLSRAFEENTPNSP